MLLDGKLGYYRLGEGLSCEPLYAYENLQNEGLSASFTAMDNTTHILTADGVELTPVGYSKVYELDGSSGRLYVVRDMKTSLCGLIQPRHQGERPRHRPESDGWLERIYALLRNNL